MAGRRRKMSRTFLSKKKKNRFRQVQMRIRRDGSGRLPVSFYGSKDILTKEQWKKCISKYNPKEMLETLNKLEEKIRLKEAGVPIPATYMVLRTQDDLERFGGWLDMWRGGFVIKPSNGHGGAGIIVVNKRVAGRFIMISGKGIQPSFVVRHAGRIIRGQYSSSKEDTALVEERIVLSRRLRELWTPGLLDIRVVVLKGFPLMAMTRIPTKRSGGKANIHKGAIGAGISISEGRICSATYLRRTIKRHPSSGRNIIGFSFTMWEEILESASAAADAMEMGFVGVDLAVDDNKGVVVIEVNKRPGLEIQNANKAGLHRRIRWVEKRIRKDKLEVDGMGPGIKAELSRRWDTMGWRKVKEGGEEE